jgi:hypothetical protein
MNIRSLIAGVAIVLVAAGLGGTASAQSAPLPVGYWVTADGSETFLIGGNGYCRFAASNGLSVEGSCEWNPSSRGGILTIMNTNNYIPAPIYYNVIWMDRQTISVFGDVFRKRG